MAAAGKKLARNVHVAGRFFAAGSAPEKEFADQITNPQAWGEDESPAATPGASASSSSSKSS